MKTVTTKPSFQGDLMVRRLKESDVPLASLVAVAADGSVHVLAHSETGHHHVVAERGARLLIDKTNALIAYLEVLEPCEIEHLREHDVHEQLGLAPGWYELRRQRELGDDGLWRAVAD